MAYLIMLIALFVMFIIMLVGEVEINHPRFIYSLINSSKSGAATNLLAGLSFGYFGNAIPIVAWTGIGFLSYYWLGSYGVGLLSIGIASLLPNYLTINTFFASIENASFIAYITQGTE
jgi:K(+)-stimulated pyrophosphate-energized sodium pump